MVYSRSKRRRSRKKRRTRKSRSKKRHGGIGSFVGASSGTHNPTGPALRFNTIHWNKKAKVPAEAERGGSNTSKK